MQLNWIDFIILAMVGYLVIEGWETGLVYLVTNLVAFLTSLWLAVKYHGLAGNFLTEKFGIPFSWTNVLGYLIVALVSEVVLSELLLTAISHLPHKVLVSKVNRWLGAALSAVNSLVLVAFFLLVILALPLRGTIKQDIKKSTIGKTLVVFVEKYGGTFKSSLDEVTREAIKFLTIEPKSTERVNLDIAPERTELRPDEASEQQLFQLVNRERANAGVSELRLDSALTAVARRHSRDMFERRYFSHLDSDGRDAKDRLEQSRVAFQVVGENLAYAPDTETAHEGLMNSENHRNNIVNPQFHRVGIGIVNGGIYGEMFTQLFAD